jgi:hypothetical protein
MVRLVRIQKKIYERTETTDLVQKISQVQYARYINNSKKCKYIKENICTFKYIEENKTKSKFKNSSFNCLGKKYVS